MGVATAARSEPGRHWQLRHTLGCVVFAAAFIAVGLLIPYRAVNDARDAGNGRLLAWALMAALLCAFIAVVGDGINGIARAALVDSRNRISLAKLQMTAWTVLLLSAYAAAALGNIGIGDAHALEVAIPRELWLAMGISTTSLVGAPLILSQKKRDRHTARDEEYARQLVLLREQGVDPKTVERIGSLVGYSDPRQSRWSDLIQGEETGNAGLLDLAKVQMLFFTLILVLVYAIGIGDTLHSTQGRIGALPNLDASMIALLAISHAGYLGKKALPKPPA